MLLQTMKTRVPLFLTLLMLSGPVSFGLPSGIPKARQGESGEDKPGFTHEDLDRALAPVFINKMADSYVAGAAVSIVKSGKIVYERGFGYGDIFEQTPVKPERTLFRIGSVTKVLTGIAVLQLVDQGLLELDADVNRYLREFKLEDKFSKPVRVRDLLTHTGGFDQLGYGRHVQTREGVKPLGEFLSDQLVRIRTPGTVSCYDTYGITLAGYLVEQVSGLKFEDYLQKKLFEPMGMSRSNTWVPEAMNDDVARGYEFRGEWLPQRWEFMNTNPASSANSTVRDMAQLMIMLTQQGTFQGKEILTRDLTRSMLTRQYSNHELLPGYGYAFWEDRKYGISAFSHGGSMTGYGCLLYIVPEEELGVFIAYNQESSRLADQVLNRLIGEFLPDPGTDKSLKPRIQGVDINRFIGTYADNMYNHTRPSRGGWLMRPFDIKADGEGNLVFRDQPAYPVGDLLFQTESGLILAFRTGREGSISHLLVDQSVFEKLTPKDLEEYRQKSRPKAIELETEVLGNYVGTYQGEEGSLSIALVEGSLQVEFPGRDAVRLSPSSRNSFFSQEGPFRLEFLVDGEGRVEQLLVRAGDWSTRFTPR